jgi:hypothetical protein
MLNWLTSSKTGGPSLAPEQIRWSYYEPVHHPAKKYFRPLEKRP